MHLIPIPSITVLKHFSISAFLVFKIQLSPTLSHHCFGRRERLTRDILYPHNVDNITLQVPKTITESLGTDVNMGPTRAPLLPYRQNTTTDHLSICSNVYFSTSFESKPSRSPGSQIQTLLSPPGSEIFQLIMFCSDFNCQVSSLSSSPSSLHCWHHQSP